MPSVLFAVGMLLVVVSPLARADAQRDRSAVVSGVAPDSGRRLVVRTPLVGRVETRSGMSGVKRGAIIGAGVGFVAGVYGGFRLADGIGCVSPLESPSAGRCNASARHRGAIISVTAVGTGLGALVGAGVGGLVHMIRGTAGPKTP